ncbi:hypothetical protein BCJMU51_4994 [Bacillus cereus]|uniref:hypothetical protein n=1 Tax=Bacillus cereus TaxID=1396 RepID=UPI001F2DE220|nr:hypothetical protein [Bacillus cereus]MCU5715435.1 hypothetical protein [Bacillus cereus]BCB40081.1 hypothetical protein BCM0045_4976 [Bacillus cereus]BCC02913.1 hypothetical protein BCM0057_4995 [Bacillus cereus]BCC26429.1 hypothetical protein BCM0079_5022 [Bacillus cereus]BCC37995.1 hypothetical protein BCM0105_4985 [Bacillus cereus]
MDIKIVDISDKLLDGYKVLVQVDSNQFIAEWDGDKPEKHENYNVEIHLDDEFIWNTNITFSDKNANAIIQNSKGFKVIAKLDYNGEGNLATLNIYDSIILIDLKGIEQDIENEWVEMQCTSIKIFNTNF